MRPATSMSPDVGFSRPAMERSVVVLPQPDGPSSVNSLPSGTSNETSCAAFTTVPLSLGYSVYSDLTFSTLFSSYRLSMNFSEKPVPTFPDHALVFGNSEFLADQLRDHH